jgi:hypothetical protein
MRKTLRLLSYILSVALVIGIVSCSKDGPQDPQAQPGQQDRREHRGHKDQLVSREQLT